jgi:hypothetical protein
MFLRNVRIRHNTVPLVANLWADVENHKSYKQYAKWDGIYRCTITEILFVPEFDTGTLYIYIYILYPFTFFHFYDGISLFRFQEVYRQFYISISSIAYKYVNVPKYCIKIYCKQFLSNIYLFIIHRHTTAFCSTGPQQLVGCVVVNCQIYLNSLSIKPSNGFSYD